MTRPAAFTLPRDILEKMTEEAKSLRDTARIAELEAETHYAAVRGRRRVELYESKKMTRDIIEATMDVEEVTIDTDLYRARRTLNRSKGLAMRAQSAYEPLGRESYKRGNQYT